MFLWSLFAILISLIGYFAIINEVECDRYNKVFTSVDKLQELEGLMNQYALQNSNHMGTSNSILKQHYLEYQKHYDFLCEERELVHVEQQPILGILEDSLQIFFIQQQTLIQQFQEKNFILEKALLGMSLESISISDQIQQKNFEREH